MAFSLNFFEQKDSIALVEDMQEKCSEKLLSLQLELDAVNLRITTLTNRLNALSDKSDSEIINNFLRAALVTRENLGREQVFLTRCRALFVEAMCLKNKQLELEKTMRDQRVQISKRQLSQRSLSDEIEALGVLNCDVSLHRMLAEKWKLEIETCAKALQETVSKKESLNNLIHHVSVKAVEFCEQPNEHVLSGSGSSPQLPLRSQ